jgi:molybdopterin converting factor small subunit
MKVTVKHFAKLRQDEDQDPTEVEMEPGSTVDDLLLKIEVEQDVVDILVINGKVGNVSQELTDNCLVTLIPYIGGG